MGFYISAQFANTFKHRLSAIPPRGSDGWAIAIPFPLQAGQQPASCWQRKLNSSAHCHPVVRSGSAARVCVGSPARLMELNDRWLSFVSNNPFVSVQVRFGGRELVYVWDVRGRGQGTSVRRVNSVLCITLRTDNADFLCILCLYPLLSHIHSPVLLNCDYSLGNCFFRSNRSQRSSCTAEKLCVISIHIYRYIDVYVKNGFMEIIK